MGDSVCVILTVTLNAAVDKTYTVENFAIDRVHRPSSWRIVPGGKGINVARVYREVGGEAVATGFIGGHNGDYILQGMREEGLKSDFVRTAGESRVCIAILDPIGKTQTELNEVGPAVTDEEVRRLNLKFESLVPGMQFAVFSGSIPPGVVNSIYRELTELARHYDVPCVLDTSGAPLAEALVAKPFMAKPNVHELSAVVGRQLGTVEEATEAAREVNRRGVDIVIVTLGRDGALAATSEGVWRARPPEIPFVSAVGSGDALAAAFLHVLATGGSVPEALRFGVGAGAANAMTFGAGFCRREDIVQLAEQTEVAELAAAAR
ncbi:MAG TPA: 1-phosphofructokinase [Armatimonadota bacterium]|nr:1-phosphofructokinase [Armatimonadota bacterium]